MIIAIYVTVTFSSYGIIAILNECFFYLPFSFLLSSGTMDMRVTSPGGSTKVVLWVLVVIFVQQTVTQTDCKFKSKIVLCKSVNFANTQCTIAEASRIISVSVFKKHSLAPCYSHAHDFFGFVRLSNTYGFRDNILWVRNWCSATFSVCYIPRGFTISHDTQSTYSRRPARPSQTTNNKLPLQRKSKLPLLQLTSKTPPYPMTSRSTRLGKTRTFQTRTISSKSTALALIQITQYPVPLQKEFNVNITRKHRRLTTKNKASLQEYAHFSSVLMIHSTSNDETVLGEGSTRKTSEVHKADTTGVPLVAVVVPTVTVVIGIFIATFFIYKRRCSLAPESKVISEQTKFSVSLDGKPRAGTRNNESASNTINLKDLQYENMYEKDKTKHQSDVDGYINTTCQFELNNEAINENTPKGNDDYHSYFILEAVNDSSKDHYQKTGVQMLPDDEYNIINMKSKEILRDPNYDVLEIQGKKFDTHSDEYSRFSSNQARAQYDAYYSHCTFNNT